VGQSAIEKLVFAAPADADELDVLAPLPSELDVLAVELVEAPAFADPLLPPQAETAIAIAARNTKRPKRGDIGRA
jgi:hypothetical protein